MPITNDTESKVSFYCSDCCGDGEGENEGDDCKRCGGSGKLIKSTVEWLTINLKKETYDTPGLYTFDDMMKAFELGTLAEAGCFPSNGYTGAGAEGVVENFFVPVPDVNNLVV